MKGEEIFLFTRHFPNNWEKTREEILNNCIRDWEQNPAPSSTFSHAPSHWFMFYEYKIFTEKSQTNLKSVRKLNVVKIGYISTNFDYIVQVIWTFFYARVRALRVLPALLIISVLLWSTIIRNISYNIYDEKLLDINIVVSNNLNPINRNMTQTTLSVKWSSLSWFKMNGIVVCK